MKANLHPQYNTQTAVSCACGNSFTSGSTKDEIRVEVCSKCHPFYTGKQKLLDTTGTLEKFKKRAEITEKLVATVKEKKPRKTKAEKTAEAK
jgi:large subunit ribosomal protein L31